MANSKIKCVYPIFWKQQQQQQQQQIKSSVCNIVQVKISAIKLTFWNMRDGKEVRLDTYPGKFFLVKVTHN